MVNKKRSVAIIGAGAAGLCAGRHFAASGFDVVIYEIGTKIGGMWCYENDSGLSPAYQSLHINTSRNVTRFQELDFDKDVQFFPDHVDMYNYLCKYAKHFGLTDKIRFQSRVVDVQPIDEIGESSASKCTWSVKTESGDTDLFDLVIVASGHLSLPNHVPMFQDDFKGEYVHASAYRIPDPYVGKKVCIVGVGNSACDISGDLCVTAQRCVLVARTGVVILPKLLFGLPFTDIGVKFQKPWIPYGLRRRITLFLTWIAHGNIKKLGFKVPNQRVHTTSNGTIINDVAYNRIQIKHGIEKINGKEIVFVDGSRDEFDVLVAATGYKIDFPFLSEKLLSFMGNQLDLYQRIVAPKLPGMYFVGFFNTDTALMKIFEKQVAWILEIETGKAKLPEPGTMQQEIDDRKSWVLQHYKDTERHRLEEESVPYLQSLKRSLRQMKKNHEALRAS